MARKVAIVVQRYGADLVGGSETLAREYAERLIGRGFDVTVYTSTARDYVTWRSEYPSGESMERGVRIRRFAPERERDLRAFNALAEPMYVRATTADDEKAFLEAQGPFVPGLIDALRADAREFEAILFFTYLYYPSVEGIKVAGDRAVFIPTAHDEPPLRFAVFKAAFEGVRSYAFCSAPEARLVASESTRPRSPTSRSSRSCAGSSAPTSSTQAVSTRARAATRCCGSTSTRRRRSWAVPISSSSASSPWSFRAFPG